MLILVCAITRCVSISTFHSLVGIPIFRASSAVRLEIFVLTTAIKKYKLIIKKKEKSIIK